jgi:Ca2+-binding RTX toxin-like protein
MPFAKIGSEFRINTTTNGVQFGADAAQLENGDIIVVWTDYADILNPNVMRQRLSASGALISGENLLSESASGFQYDASITALANGGYAASWTDSRANTNLDLTGVGIMGRTFSANGSPVAESEQAFGNDRTRDAGSVYDGQINATASAIVVHPSASATDYLVFFESATDYERTSFVEHRWARERAINFGNSLDSPYGGTITSDYEYDEIAFPGAGAFPFPNPGLETARFTGPDALTLDDGTVVVVYTRFNADGADQTGRVFVERWEMDNITDPDYPVLVSQNDTHILGSTSLQDFDGKIAQLADGGYVVVWRQYDDNNPSSTTHAQAQIFNADGTRRGGEFEVSSGGQFQQNLSVAGLADGRWVVVWSGNYTDGEDTSGAAIKGRVFTADGEAAAPVFTVNTTTTGDQTDPDVTALDDGNFLVTWNGGTDIKTQLFDPTEFQGAALDSTIIGGDFADTIFGGTGDNRIEGRAGRDSLSGEAGDDTLIGGRADDVLNGGTEADIMEGGQGSDTYFVDNAGDVATELEGNGTDTVWTTINYTLEDNVEILRNFALTGNLSLTGNELGNSIYGSTLTNDTISGEIGDDFLYGNGGNDNLYGNHGLDVLDGGSGNDDMFGGFGSDTYYVSSTRDTVTEEAGEGTADTVFSLVNFTLGNHVENLLLDGTGDLSGFGNNIANTIFGNSGDNRIEGAGGADTLLGLEGDDNLRGNAGSDYLDGGSGNDFASYYYDIGVNASLDGSVPGTGAALGDIYVRIENLSGSNTGGDQLSGDDFANKLYGNGGEDTLLGYDGNDILRGGAGEDNLSGGVDADTFEYRNTAEGGDIISYFSSLDLFSFRGAAFGSLGAGTLNTTNFVSRAADNTAQDNNDLFIFREDNDTLWYDSDGNGLSAAILIADMTNNATITAGDILIT